MNCLNLSLSVPYKGKEATIETVLADLTEVVGDKDVAYALLTENNGFPLDKTNTGAPSLLYTALEHIAASPDEAIVLKARTFTTEFKEEFGSWSTVSDLYNTDLNMEPEITSENGVHFYTSKRQERMPIIPGNNLKALGSILSPIESVRQSRKVSNATRAEITKVPYSELKGIAIYTEQGVNVMRKSKTFKMFGNPWTGSNVKGAIQVAGEINSKQAKELAAYNYFKWLTTNEFNDVNPKQRAWILKEIAAGRLKNKPLLYMFTNDEYKSHADALAEAVVLLTKDTADGVEVKSGDTATLSGFMVANKLIGLKISEKGTQAETDAAFTYITDEAAKYNIKIDPNTKFKGISEFNNDKEGTGSTVALGKSLNKYSKEAQARFILNSALWGVVSKRIDGMSEEELDEYFDGITSFVDSYMPLNPDTTILLQELVGLGPKAFTKAVFTNEKLAHMIGKENLDSWENLSSVVLDAVPIEHRTEVMLSIVSANVSKLHAVDEQISPLIAATVKRESEMSSRERDEILGSQFISDPGGMLKVGSVASFSSKGAGTQKVLILSATTIKGKQVYRGLKYSAKYLASGNKGVVFTGDDSNFTKLGDYHMMETEERGNVQQIAVLPGNFTVNFTKAARNKGFINTETHENTDNLITNALAYGQMQKIPVEKKNISYSSEGLYYAMTNSTITKPKGGTWGLSKMSKRPDNTKVWYAKFADRGFEWEGVTYRDVEEAYQELKHNHKIGGTMKVIAPNKTHRIISPRDAFMERLIVAKLEQYPELYHAIKQEMGDTPPNVFFATLEHKVAGNDTHWSSTGANGFVKAFYAGFMLHHTSTPVTIEQTVDDANDEILNRISAAVAFKATVKQAPSVIEGIVTMLEDNVAGTFTISKAEAVLRLYAESSNYGSISEYMPGATEEEVLIAYHSILDILGVEVPVVVTTPVVEKANKYPADTPVPFDLENNTEEGVQEKLIEISEAVSDKVKVFKTMTKEDAIEYGEEMVENVVAYIVSNGYFEKVVDGIRELHLEEASQETAVKSVPVLKAEVKVPEKTTRIDFKVKTLPATSTEEFIVERDANGKVMSFSINPKLISATNFIALLKKADRSNFSIAKGSTSLLNLLIAVHKEEGRLPRNLFVTKGMRDAVLSKLNNLSIKVEKTGVVTIKGHKLILDEINIHFDLSNDQTKALATFADWVNTPTKRPLVLQGNAGTGKTTLLRVAKHYADTVLNRKTTFTALTNAATVNLEKIIGHPSTTLHSLLGIHPSIDLESGASLAFDDVNFDSAATPPGSVVFIDEIGLASDKIMDTIYDILAQEGIKVVMLGSASQLDAIQEDKAADLTPPVAHPAFDASINTVINLEEVKRQGSLNPGAALLHRLATHQTEGFRTEGVVSPNAFYDTETGEGIEMIGGVRNYMSWAIDNFRLAMKENNPTKIRLQTVSNKKADWCNTIIRSQILQNPANLIDEGEYVFLAEAHADPMHKKGLQYTATDVHVTQEAIVPGSELTLKVFNAKLVPADNYPDPKTGEPALHPITIRVAAPDSQANEELRAAMIAKDNTRIAVAAKAMLEYKTKDTLTKEFNEDPAIIEYGEYIDELRKAAYIEQQRGGGNFTASEAYKDAVGTVSFMFPVKVSTVKGVFTAVKKNLSYGYASTVNKAMGSTFEMAGVDVEEATKIFGTKARKGKLHKARAAASFNKTVYTGASRASMHAVLYTGKNELTDNTQDEIIDLQRTVIENKSRQSRKITKPNGKKVREHSIEDNISKVIQKTNSRAKVAGINENIDTIAKEHLLEANPEGVVVALEGDRRLTVAYNTMLQAIATDPTDARIAKEVGTSGIITYNQWVYDRYINSVYATVREELTAEDYYANKSIAFELRHVEARNKLEREKYNLEQQLSNKRRDPNVPETVLNTLREDIKNREEHIKAMKSAADVDTMMAMAMADSAVVTRILAQPSIDTEDFNRVQRLIYTWRNAANLDDRENHPFMVEDEMDDYGFRKLFTELGSVFSEHAVQLNKIGRSLLISRIAKNLGVSIPYDALLRLNNKVGWFAKNVLSIGKLDNPIIAHVMMLINDSNKRKDIEALSRSKQNADLMQVLRDKQFDTNIFWEITEDDIITGNITSEYSYEYNELYKNRLYGKSVLAKFKAATIIIDPLRLDTEADREAYIQELAKEVPEDKARNSVEEALARYKKYKVFRNDYMVAAYGVAFADRAKLSEEDSARFELWAYQNSPEHRRYQYETESDPKEMHPDRSSERFLTIIPKDTDATTLQKTSWYSKAFAEVQTDADAKAYMDFAHTATREARQNFNRTNMSDYALGEVATSLTSQLVDSGVSKVLAARAKETFLEPFTGGYDKKEFIDPLTGKDIKYVKAGVTTLEDSINAEVNKMKLERYPNKKKWQFDSVADTQKLKELYAEASKKVMSENIPDIAMAINNLNMASVGYKYKNEVKPDIDMAMHYIDKMEAGEQRSPSARTIDKKDVVDAQQMTEHFVNKELYDEGAPDTTYKLPIRFLTAEKKAKKAELEEKIATIEAAAVMTAVDKTNLTEYKKQLENIGGYVTVGSILDRAMTLLRTSTMGWNMASAFANLLQGQLANVIMSASGVHYDFTELRQGAAKLITDGKKFTNAVNNYALLGDIMYDMTKGSKFRDSGGAVSGALRVLDPFMGTKVTEKANQGTIMIAMMLRIKVQKEDSSGNLVEATDADGKPLSMWEAISEEGLLSDEYHYDGKSGVAAVSKAVLLISEQVAAIHGDYINPKMLQDLPIGRAAMMFKVWFFDPYMVRFGTHRHNFILKKDTKGRYITLLERIVENKLNLTKYYSDYSEGKLTELDQENMRVNFAETMAILSLYLVQALVGKLLCAEEGNEKCKGVAAYLLNLMNRWVQETTTFTNPKNWYDTIKNPIAVSRYLNQLDKIWGYASDAVFEDKPLENADGDNKILKVIGSEIPLIRRAQIESELAEKELPSY